MRFLRPDLIGWWLAVPAVVALWALGRAYVRAVRRRSPVADRFAALSRRSTPLGSAGVLIFAVAAVAGLVFALMRPQALLTERVPEYERQDVIFVLDRSASMRAHDIAPSRFLRATLEIRTFLREKPAAIDRVGLVGFADASVVLSYLTSDVDSLMFYLDWIDQDPSAFFGTNIGAGLKSAREVAEKDDRATRKLFLLMSDGEDYGNDLQNALSTFRAEGRRVYCIGIGSDADVPIPLRQPDGQEAVLRDDAGRQVTTRFDESTLRQIAATTGGRYVRSMKGSELAGVIADIVRGERKLVGWRTSTEYRDLHPAGLALAGVAGAALWLLL
ncbi:MAG TPA: VWA domain-containing protein [Vicinamibacterales bacterium]|jgi:Ca-activated chloride channel family protein|nr:VWA domain-containing protein [Vicinamibacterales bacterium]